MAAELQTLDSLPRHSASQVKNKWGDVVRQVNRSGVAAVTNHSTVEMVLMPAAEYERLREYLPDDDFRRITQRFDARLALLQQPDAAARVEALFESRGQVAPRPKAGASF